MNTKKVYNRVEDFLKDDDFIKYVLDAAPETASHWEELLEEHTEQLKVFEEAKMVLLASENMEYMMSPSEQGELKQRIFATLNIEDRE
ncbi:hypothetical protein [Bacteroidaceae bacterium]|nr:hypothetical protein [Bacteroides sp.]